MESRSLTAPPIVGSRYPVPCILHRGQAYPVLGEPHEDPQITSIGLHIHYDPRFISDEQVVVRIPGLTIGQVAQVIAHRLRGGEVFEARELECLREMPPFPRGHEAAPWVGTLEEAHRWCRSVGGVCPHAGTDGRSFPRAADGSWECIHGLRWRRDGTLVL